MRMWQVHPLSSTWYLYCFGLHSAAFGNRLTKADLKWLLSPPQVMFHPASRLPSGPHIFVTLGKQRFELKIAEVLGIDDLMDVYWNTIEYASGSTWGFLILKLSILMIFAAPRIISDIQEAQTPPNLCYYLDFKWACGLSITCLRNPIQVLLSWAWNLLFHGLGAWKGNVPAPLPPWRDVSASKMKISAARK